MPPVNTCRLRERRIELDLSVKDVADRIGRSYNYVSDVLRGVGSYGPSDRTIYQLSRALDLPVDEITQRLAPEEPDREGAA